MHIKLGKNLIQQQQQKIWEKTLFNINREVVDLQTQGKKKKKQTMKGKQQEEEGTVNG